MSIRIKKSTSTAIVTSEFNISKPGNDIEMDVLYILEEVTISKTGEGIAKFSLSIDGVAEGIKQSFPFKLDSGVLFAEIEAALFSSQQEFLRGVLAQSPADD